MGQINLKKNLPLALLLMLLTGLNSLPSDYSFRQGGHHGWPL